MVYVASLSLLAFQSTQPSQAATPWSPEYHRERFSFQSTQPSQAATANIRNDSFRYPISRLFLLFFHNIFSTTTVQLLLYLPFQVRMPRDFYVSFPFALLLILIWFVKMPYDFSASSCFLCAKQKQHSHKAFHASYSLSIRLFYFVLRYKSNSAVLRVVSSCCGVFD